jgi:hypothetical protein
MRTRSRKLLPRIPLAALVLLLAIKVAGLWWNVQYQWANGICIISNGSLMVIRSSHLAPGARLDRPTHGLPAIRGLLSSALVELSWPHAG